MPPTNFTQAPASYTPSTNATPTFGQSGASVVALQNSINAKNATTPGNVPLKVDGLFGPKTYAAANTDSNLVATSGQARTAFNQNSTDLGKLLGSYGITQTDPNAPATGSEIRDASGHVTGHVGIDPNTGQPKTDPNASTAPGAPTAPTIDPNLGTANDPFIQQLTKVASNSNASTKLMIQNIQSEEQRQATTLTQQSENYQKGLQLLGIQSGKESATPDILMGHIQEAKTALQDKLSTLTANETKAISDAQTSQDNKDFTNLKTQMDYIKQVQTEKTTAIKDYYTELTSYNKDATATAKGLAPDIYTAMQGLDEADKQTFINAIAKKMNIPAGTLVSELGSVHTKDMLSTAEAKTLGVPFGTTKTQAEKMNITPKSGTTKSTTVTSAAALKAATTEINTALKTGKDANGNSLGNARGADGYVDPGVYTAALAKWPGTQKQFLAAFPVKGNVNPLSYTKLPEAIQSSIPKTKGSTPVNQAP